MPLLTGLTNPHAVHTGYIRDVAAIIMVRGKRPPPGTIRLAEELQIPILSTEYVLFETVGRLYVKGIVGNRKKWEKKAVYHETRFWLLSIAP